MKTCSQKDLARMVGVSQRAVASVVGKGRSHSGARVSAATRARILAAARRMDYRPHRHAQILRGVKSGVIGILQTGRLQSFAAERALAMADAVIEAGYEVLPYDVLRNEGARVACDRMLEAHVEGLLLASPANWLTATEIRRLQRRGLPLVALSGVNLPGVPRVGADARGGMRALTEHLLSLGRRRLALLVVASKPVSSGERVGTSGERAAGFQEAIRAAGGRVLESQAEPLTNDEDPERAVGYVVWRPYGDYWTSPFAVAREPVREVLAWKNPPDALLCMNDDWAFESLAVSREMQWRVPEDLAITGFDGSLLGASTSPRLTTVAQPLKEMARKAVDLLLRQIRGEKLAKGEMLTRLPCRLVVRQSCGGAGLPTATDLNEFQESTDLKMEKAHA